MNTDKGISKIYFGMICIAFSGALLYGSVEVPGVAVIVKAVALIVNFT